MLNVSAAEAAEYERYKERYQAFWLGLFDPIAVRITVDRRLKLEVCVLPTANGDLYQQLRGMVAKEPKTLDTARLARSAVGSFLMVPGRNAIAQWLRDVPGVAEVLRANPDAHRPRLARRPRGAARLRRAVDLEIDPAELRPLQLPLLGNFSLEDQGLAVTALIALKLPMYATIDVENRDQAAQLLDRLSREVVLKGANLGGLAVTSDAYRLPDYKRHPLYVFSVQAYALKLRLHVAVVGGQIVAATRPEVLRQAIDASLAAPNSGAPAGQFLVRSIARRSPAPAATSNSTGRRRPGRPAIGTSARWPICTSSTACRWTGSGSFRRPSTASATSARTTANIASTPSATRLSARSTATARIRTSSRCPKARPRSAGSSRASTK